jgi:hypothetical protein
MMQIGNTLLIAATFAVTLAAANPISMVLAKVPKGCHVASHYTFNSTDAMGRPGAAAILAHFMGKSVFLPCEATSDPVESKSCKDGRWGDCQTWCFFCNPDHFCACVDQRCFYG